MGDRILAEWSETNKRYGWTILYRVQEQGDERWIESAAAEYDPPFWEREPPLSRPEHVEAALREHLPMGHPDRPPIYQEALF